MLQRDLSHLSTKEEDTGFPPDQSSEFVMPLVEWLQGGVDTSLSFQYDPDKPQVGSTLTRHSAAGSCLKRVALLRDGVESQPMDAAGVHITGIGTLVHAAWQAALDWKINQNGSVFRSVAFEVPSIIDDLTSGSSDAVIDEADTPRTHRHVLEAKTCGGFKYKLLIGERGKPQGPSHSNMVQLALNVMGHDAHRGTLIYLSNEAISKGIADRKGIDEVTRFGAQWTFDREQLQPLADEWLEQLRYVRDHPTDEVPRFWPHELPKGARIVDPNTSRWELRDGEDIIDTGSVWGGQGCSYCPVQTACAKAWADGR